MSGPKCLFSEARDGRAQAGHRHRCHTVNRHLRFDLLQQLRDRDIPHAQVTEKNKPRLEEAIVFPVSSSDIQ